MAECAKCRRPAEVTLCWDCTKRLREILIEVADLAQDLEIQVTRQSVAAKSPGGEAAETPLMFDEYASEVARVVRDTLQPYYMPTGKLRAVELLGLSVYAQIEWMARILAFHVSVLVRDESNRSLYEEVMHARSLILKAIDRRPNLILLGVCGCKRPVYSLPDKRVYVCECGQVFDVQASRKILRGLGRDQLVTARQAEQLGEIEGKQLKAATIWKWVQRGKLDVADTDSTTGDRLYRFGDLLDLVCGDPAAKAE